jgi:hypothetical protein
VLVAVLHDGELIPEVPVHQHDMRVGAALLPSGVQELSPVMHTRPSSRRSTGDPYAMPSDADTGR